MLNQISYYALSEHTLSDINQMTDISPQTGGQSKATVLKGEGGTKHVICLHDKY